MRALYIFGHTIARGVGITKNMLLTIQKCTIAREIRCDVANLLLKFKKIIIIEKIIKKFVVYVVVLFISNNIMDVCYTTINQSKIVQKVTCTPKKVPLIRTWRNRIAANKIIYYKKYNYLNNSYLNEKRDFFGTV